MEGKGAGVVVGGLVGNGLRNNFFLVDIFGFLLGGEKMGGSIEGTFVVIP